MFWQRAHNFPILQTNQAHIWRARLDCSEQEIVKLTAILSPEEKARAARFVVRKAANGFVIARGVLRALLAKYLNAEPQHLVFQQNQYGKIYLERVPLQFNISHSQDLALFIFSWHQPVGIDVELMRIDIEFADIARKFFSKREVLELFSLPKEQQLRAFFNCWVCKEAFIKARGIGMYSALDKFSVEISPNANGRVRIFYSDEEKEVLNVKKWVLEALDPAVAGYVGAFVVGKEDEFVDCNASFYDFVI